MEGSPFTLDDPLPDRRRLAERIARMPRGQRVRGMFLAPLVRELGAAAYEALRPELVEPRHERYLAFRDYPQADHARLLVALAAARSPSLPESEALRRLAREDMRVFGRSTLGRVMLALVGDPVSALLRVPAAYERVAPGLGVSASRGPRGSVTLDYAPFHGLYGYQLGQLEGIVRHFGGRPRIDAFESDEAPQLRLVVSVT